MELEVLVVSALLGTVQGLQLGPFTSTCAVPGSKLLPLMLKVNCRPASGGLGEVVRLPITGAGAVTIHVIASLFPPVALSESTSEYTPACVYVNGPNVYWPLLLAVVPDVLVLPLGSVIVAVTPPFRVAPLPVTVNWVTPAVPVDGETRVESADLFTDNVADPEACKPPSSVTVQVAVYVPVLEGAVQVTVAPFHEKVPPVKLHA
jgi:hypothetical protein